MPAVRFRTRTLGQRELPRGQDFRWIRGDVHEPRTDAIGRSGQLHAGRRRGLRHQVLEDRGHRTPPADVKKDAVRTDGYRYRIDDDIDHRTAIQPFLTLFYPNFVPTLQAN